MITREIDGDLLVHDDQSGSTHRLNAAARFIWQLCDGDRDVAAIASEVAACFDQLPASLAADVDQTLTHFRDVGLILSAPGSHGEEQVLLHYVRTAIGTKTPESMGTAPTIDWNALVHVALAHGVMPLLFRGLQRRGGDAVPPLVRDRLRRLYQANARASRVLVRELLQVLAAFERHGIPALPLKGPVLARGLYGSTALRVSGDLDIFVQPRHANLARDVLAALGYQFLRTRQADAEAERATEDGPVIVDLHWALSMPEFCFPIDLEQLWPRLHEVSLAGTTVLQPAPGDELMILCAHASKHCWCALTWIVDIALFLRRYQHSLDWSGLLKRARDVGGERQLLLGLRLAHDVLGAEVPQDAAGRMFADDAVDALCAELRQRLFASVPARSYQGSFGFLDGGWLYTKTRERLRDRIPYALKFLQKVIERSRFSGSAP